MIENNIVFRRGGDWFEEGDSGSSEGLCEEIERATQEKEMDADGTGE